MLHVTEDETRDLVDANHILANKGIVDGFGHVSVRLSAEPSHFRIARSMSPALVESGDLMLMNLDGAPEAADTRNPYLERFIHGEIYRVRPDVRAVIHSHSPAVIPFAAVSSRPLRPLYHMASGIGATVPVFDIRGHVDMPCDMLVRDRRLGAALADTLGPGTTVLMRGHGITIAGATLREVVFIAAYAELNARLQREAIQLGDPEYLDEGEIAEAWQTNRKQVDRAWSLWEREVSQSR
jgi:ribulose-5-phosphate 4-epimerase/fuculose-1-phosphate aldolase